MRAINSIFILFLFGAILGAFRASASDLTSPSFIIRDPVVGVGGGYGSSGSFQLFNSQDSILTGVGAAADFIGHYGFLYFPSAVTPTPTPTPTPSGGGVNVYNTGCSQIADFNCDGRVDLLDLSILLYYTDKSGPAIVPYDLNKDGKISLEDISIMFYYWTAF